MQRKSAPEMTYDFLAGEIWEEFPDPGEERGGKTSIMFHSPDFCSRCIAGGESDTNKQRLKGEDASNYTAQLQMYSGRKMIQERDITMTHRDSTFT